MKLIIGGSSGFLGTEVIRQALESPDFSSIVALSRRETPVPPNTSAANAAKLKSVVCNDFENYSEDVKTALEGADACIWTIAVTPRKSKESTWDEIVKITRGYAVYAIQTLGSLPRKQNTPFRFMYISGHFAHRNKDEPVPEFVVANGMREMVLMRGDVEQDMLDYASKSGGQMEVAIARPGLITTAESTAPPSPNLPTVRVEETTAALLQQVVGGFEKETIYNDDLVRIGKTALK